MKRKWMFAALAVAGVIVALGATTVAQEEKKEDRVLDEGEWVSLEGQLAKQGDRPAIKVSEGEHKGKTFVLLENARLEELEQWVKENKPEKVEISCDVTRYNKKNFLVISSFVKPDDEEEEPEDEDKEEEDE